MSVPTQTQAADTGDDESPSATSGPVISVASGERTLTPQDARATLDWAEGNYTPAGQPTAVTGLRAELNCYSEPKVLELRFTQTSGELKVNVAQDMDSESSHQAVEFKLTADGKRVDIKTVAFKEPAVLKTNLAGVTVVEISARLAPESQNTCDSEGVYALLTKMTVTS